MIRKSKKPKSVKYTRQIDFNVLKHVKKTQIKDNMVNTNCIGKK